MIDASSGWPVSVKAACIEESISFFEEEVIGDELVLVLLGHGCKGVICTSMLAGQFLESI